jgi:hypothetical protein
MAGAASARGRDGVADAEHGLPMRDAATSAGSSPGVARARSMKIRSDLMKIL